MRMSDWSSDVCSSDLFEAYFRAWGQFQARFFEGVQLWRGHYDDLRIRAASTDNPYRFFFETAQRHLFGLPLELPLGTRWSTTWAQIKSDRSEEQTSELQSLKRISYAAFCLKTNKNNN